MIAVQTHSGIMWNLLNPRNEDVRLEDIAWSLGHIPRFNGHTRSPYTVADHCLWIYDRLGSHQPLTRAYALLHDAHEAYIGDIPSPVKEAVAILCEGENPLAELARRTDTAIYEALGLPYPAPSDIGLLIADADRKAAIAERIALMPDRGLTGEYGPVIASWRPGKDWLKRIKNVMGELR